MTTTTMTTTPTTTTTATASATKMTMSSFEAARFRLLSIRRGKTRTGGTRNGDADESAGKGAWDFREEEGSKALTDNY